VQVRDGEARLVDTGSLAGSTLTMDAAVRRAVVECGLSVTAAAEAAATNPARVLGAQDRIGSITPGLAADLVLLDEKLQVQTVICAGRLPG
jgi:N-acetylglucosamine-6-phosphate deacetylase